MTSAPASWISRAISPVSPAPPAAFSPLAITRSMSRSRFTAGRSAATAWRPGFPTTSPTKRTLIRAGGRSATKWLSRERVSLIEAQVESVDAGVVLTDQAVVLIDQRRVGRVDVRRDTAGILRLDRGDPASDGRELRVRGVDRRTGRSEARVERCDLRHERIRLRHARVRWRWGDLDEPHGVELALAESIRARDEPREHEA